MSEEHEHEYRVRAWPTDSPAKIATMERELQQLFNDGWLPASGFVSLATVPRDQVLVVIFAKNKEKK